jgi:hypothetical protein
MPSMAFTLNNPNAVFPETVERLEERTWFRPKSRSDEYSCLALNIDGNFKVTLSLCLTKHHPHEDVSID